ncbi:MAG: DUF4065 domain-containing protein [Nitrososphaeria archaeon]
MIFKGLAVISFLVKKMSEKYPSKQIGKTIIQKMMYLIKREGIVDYTYSMYHYGPYSSEVSSELNLCEALDILAINWDPNKGYIISRKENKYEKELSKKDKKKIEKIVDKYGRFNAKELSIIASAFFLKDEIGNISSNEELVKIIASLKPDYDEGFIRNILEKSGVIS